MISPVDNREEWTNNPTVYEITILDWQMSWELGRRELGTGSSRLGTGSSSSFDDSNKCRMTHIRCTPIGVAADRPGRGVSAKPKVGNWVVAHSMFLMIVADAPAGQTCFVAP